MTLTKPAVSAISISSACQFSYPAPGRVAPRCWIFPNTAKRKRQARVAPTSWMMM